MNRLEALKEKCVASVVHTGCPIPEAQSRTARPAPNRWYPWASVRGRGSALWSIGRCQLDAF